MGKNYRKLIECRFLEILYKIYGIRKINWSIEKSKRMEVWEFEWKGNCEWKGKKERESYFNDIFDYV